MSATTPHDPDTTVTGAAGLAEGSLLVEKRDRVLHITFNRPHARNAMTNDMYDALAQTCDDANSDDDLAAVVLRGAGDRAFVAGTDIAQFRSFTGEDGVAYEERIASILARLRAVQVPVVAVIDGHCVGGGLGLASCADLRLATPRASFGMPIARTLGNTLAAGTLKRLVTLLGEAWVVRMTVGGERLSGEQAASIGFARLVADDIEEATDALLDHIRASSPLTLWSIKELLRRGAGHQEVEDADVITRIYGSEDFAGAVDGFLEKTNWTWLGR